MVKRSESVEWAHNGESRISGGNRDRCIQGRMGGHSARERPQEVVGAGKNNCSISMYWRGWLFCFALKVFLKNAEGVSVLIQSDNMSVVSQIQRR